MKWFRLYDEITEDSKIIQLSDQEFRVWILTLCHASKQVVRGYYSSSKSLVSLLKGEMNCKSKSIESAFQKLESLGMIKLNNESIQIVNWNKRQFRSDDVSERVKRYRNVTRNVTETPSDTDTDTDKDIYSPQIRSEDTPHQQIIDIYHEILPECRKVKIWSENRQKKLRSRWREDPKRQELDWWRVYFQNVRLCFWFTTENTKNWYPDLEWLVEKRNLINVIEKRYFNERT